MTTRIDMSIQTANERDQVILRHLPQVKAIAAQIHLSLPTHILRDDLIHAGVLGLLDAYEKYDATRNVKFSSYAAFRIRGAILDSLRDLDWSPRQLRRAARQIECAGWKLSQELGRTVTISEVAQHLGVSIEKLQKQVAEIAALSIEVNLDASDRGATEAALQDLAEPESKSPLARSIEAECRQILMKAIEELPEKERQVMVLYYFGDLTMPEIAATLGVSETRVSQLHSGALKRLRRRMQPHGVRTLPPNNQAPHMVLAVSETMLRAKPVYSSC